MESRSLPPGGCDKAVAVLQAYFDESGISTDAPYCVLMGFVGTSQKWSLFEEGWLDATERISFHAKRFFGRDSHGRRLDAYKGWSDEKASKYLEKIIGVITSRVAHRVLTPIGAAVDASAFRALSKAERQYLTGCFLDRRMRTIGTGAPSKPYFAALVQCVTAAARCAKGHAVVDFVFDQNNNFGPLALKQFGLITERAQEDFRKRLGTLVFMKSESVGGLQAADLAAYCWFQRAVGGYERKHDLVTAIESLSNVFHESDGRLAILHRENMQKLLAHPDAIRAVNALG